MKNITRIYFHDFFVFFFNYSIYFLSPACSDFFSFFLKRILLVTEFVSPRTSCTTWTEEHVFFRDTTINSSRNFSKNSNWKPLRTSKWDPFINLCYNSSRKFWWNPFRYFPMIFFSGVPLVVPTEVFFFNISSETPFCEILPEFLVSILVEPTIGISPIIPSGTSWWI